MALNHIQWQISPIFNQFQATAEILLGNVLALPSQWHSGAAGTHLAPYGQSLLQKHITDVDVKEQTSSITASGQRRAKTKIPDWRHPCLFCVRTSGLTSGSCLLSEMSEKGEACLSHFGNCICYGIYSISYVLKWRFFGWPIAIRTVNSMSVWSLQPSLPPFLTSAMSSLELVTNRSSIASPLVGLSITWLNKLSWMNSRRLLDSIQLPVAIWDATGHLRDIAQDQEQQKTCCSSLKHYLLQWQLEPTWAFQVALGVTGRAAEPPFILSNCKNCLLNMRAASRNAAYRNAWENRATWYQHCVLYFAALMLSPGINCCWNDRLVNVHLVTHKTWWRVSSNIEMGSSHELSCACCVSDIRYSSLF